MLTYTLRLPLITMMVQEQDIPFTESALAKVM
jgi:hypothetical protein